MVSIEEAQPPLLMTEPQIAHRSTLMLTEAVEEAEEDEATEDKTKGNGDAQAILSPRHRQANKILRQHNHHRNPEDTASLVVA